MRELRVDFNNVIGSGVIHAPANGEHYADGETIAIFDHDTHTYEATVISQTGNTVHLQVRHDPDQNP